MHGPQLLIPILVPLGLFAMIFGIVYMNKRENLAMIEKGMNPKKIQSAPFINLKWGLLLVGAGTGMFLAYLFSEFLLPGRDNDVLFLSLIAIGGGIGLIGSYRIEKRDERVG
jgi:hypothetical protein